jgi:SAM-dependent methyltransferase
MGRGEKRFHEKRINNTRYPHMARAINEALKWTHIDKVDRVLDVGSSCGGLLAELEKTRSFKKAVGIDISDYAVEFWQPKKADIHLRDMNTYFDVGEKDFDLIVCLEVAEHLKTEKYLFDFFDRVSHDDTILVFSGAYPGQRGRGHINCHWHGYWIDELEKRGWHYNHQPTAQFLYEIGRGNKRRVNVPVCYLNSFVFQKATDINSEDGLRHKDGKK